MSSQRSWQGLDLRGYRRSRCLLIFVLLALPLSATTYYVDNCVVTGNDSNNGTSTSTPWLTVAHVNAQTFNPGDSVLFEKTCTWREQLQPPSAGSAGNPITLTSYGTGAQPIITGFDVMTGFSVVSGSVYSLSGVTTAPTVVAYNGTLLSYNHIGTSITANQWDWASNVLYINVGGSPSETVEVGQRSFSANINNKNYVVLNNLALTGANAAAVFLNTNASYATVQNSTVFNTFQGIVNATDSGSNNLIQNNTIYNSVQYGILINNASVTNYTIQNNEIYNVGGLGGTATDMQGIFAHTGAGLLIQSNYIHDVGDSVADHGIYLSGSNGTAGTIIIRANKVVNPKGSGIKVSNSQHVDVYYNVVSGFAASGIVVEVGSPSYVNLYNNTIANSAAGTGASGLHITAGDHITFKNNIIYNVNYTSPNLSQYNIIYVENSPTNLAIDSNVVYDPTPNASYYANYNGTAKTWAAWQAAGYDTHGVKADPMFTNPGSSIFTLQSSSPAIDAGTNLGATYQMGLNPSSSWPSSVSTLNQNDFGAGWEIGAFVFVEQIPPAPPTSLSCTVK